MLPELDSISGSLPVGRHTVPIDEVRIRFVDSSNFSASTRRARIWNDFIDLTTKIRSIVPVVNVWIGGSFITDKIDPEDIDVVYWCHDEAIDSALRHSQIGDKTILIRFLNRQINLPTVHYFACAWHLLPEVGLVRPEEYDRYVWQRGHWDDFWLRRRSGAHKHGSSPNDALPRGGYIELVLDNFDAN